MKKYIQLIRPNQWIKNTFVFLPLFFGGRMLNVNTWIDALVVFVVFCLSGSAVYCMNDIVDAELDQCHPLKKNRPIASGAVSSRQGWLCMAACLFACIIILFVSKPGFPVISVVAIYILLNVFYSFWLKNIAIVDIIIIATGFALRVIAGGLSTEILVSHWIIMMTFLLALFLAAQKRRYDLVESSQTETLKQKETKGYSIEYLNVAIGIIASVTIVCYIMYSVSPEVTSRLQTNYLYVTTIFVIAGLLRYIQRTVLDDKQGTDPTYILLHDRFIQICLLFWILSFAIIIYVM